MPYVGMKFISLTTYKQMIGRAGRAGKAETGESFIICQLTERRKFIEMLQSSMERSESAFFSHEELPRSIILSLINTGLCKNAFEIEEYCKHLLAHLQKNPENESKDVETIFRAALNKLMNENEIYRLNEVHARVEYPNLDDRLAIRSNAKVALSTGLSISCVEALKAKLNKAKKRLILANDLHLLSICAPINDFYHSIDYTKFYLMLIDMSEDDKRVAKACGITESTVVKMCRGFNFDNNQRTQHLQFFLALVIRDLSNGRDVHEVAKKYEIDRSMVQKLVQLASQECYRIVKFSEMTQEFWYFREIFNTFGKRLQYCCSSELVPLMELPFVKIVSSFKINNIH
jgi:replicative superfamily II helicase